MLMAVKGFHPGVSQDAMSQMLTAVKQLLPPENRLPDTFAKALKVVETDLIGVRMVDMCEDDHVIFVGEFADLHTCPKKDCGKARYSDARMKVPVKKLPYIPLIPRIKRLLEVPSIQKLLNEQIAAVPPPVMRDVWDSPLIINLYRDGAFGDVCRDLVFAISIDGFDPFNHNKLSYSMTPVIMTCLNFSPEVRHKLGFMLLSSIIPGPKAPRDINCSLQLLVDELLETGQQGNGIHIDGNLYKTKLALGVFDFPGCGKVTKGAGSGSKEHCCRKCMITGAYYRGYGTVLYGQHRRFLPMDHPMRMDEWGDGNTELREPPEKRDTVEFLANGRLVQELQDQIHEEEDPRQKRDLNRELQTLMKSTGKKGLEEFARLPDYIDMQIPVDPMHTVQVVMKKFMTYFQGRGPVNWAKIIETEHSLGRHEDVTLENNPWTLTRDQKVEADNRLRSIRVPANFDWKPCALFSDMAYMKSITYKRLATHGIIRFVLRGMLGAQQRQSLFAMCKLLSKLLEYTFSTGDMQELQPMWSAVLAQLERDYPLGMQTILFHQMQHLPDDVLMCGPAHGWSMFAFERFMSFLRGRIHNRKDPEVTAVESYRIFELCQYMVMKGVITPDGLCHPDFLEQCEVPQYTQSGRRAVVYVMSEQECRNIKELLGVTEIISCIKELHAENVNPRRNRYTCREKEGRQTMSSYTARRGDDEDEFPQFGQILHFISVSDGENIYKLAKVEWFCKPVYDEDSMLWTARLDEPRAGTNFMDVRHLPPPIVTAVEGDVMWFLDFMWKYSP